MSSCCHDPTEPPRADPRDILREQVHYDNLVRDLFTEDPERIWSALRKKSRIRRSAWRPGSGSGIWNNSFGWKSIHSILWRQR
ncbi:hypothetical protein [Methylomicrobium album]|uniref:Uncharacterized protein n=1 Tax=Methylomicrobium album BG8 TaxID=686340 RepID=H8GR96_METAL|nr:hypothetical protein [Methylomicrobium album]EIC29923.1 hypothetical protein Metal_2171 [Methylomicrobium album BG8]